jgi:hypothetical protein
MDTIAWVERVMVPPDWYVSFSGIGSMVLNAELNDTLVVLNFWRARFLTLDR